MVRELGFTTVYEPKGDAIVAEYARGFQLGGDLADVPRPVSSSSMACRDTLRDLGQLVDRRLPSQMQRKREYCPSLASSHVVPSIMEKPAIPRERIRYSGLRSLSRQARGS